MFRVVLQRRRGHGFESRWNHLGPVSRKSQKLFGPEKPFVKTANRLFWKADLLHYFKETKRKMIVKFDDLNPLRSWDTKGIVAPEDGP